MRKGTHNDRNPETKGRMTVSESQGIFLKLIEQHYFGAGSRGVVVMWFHVTRRRRKSRFRPHSRCGPIRRRVIKAARHLEAFQTSFPSRPVDSQRHSPALFRHTTPSIVVKPCRLPSTLPLLLQSVCPHMR